MSSAAGVLERILARTRETVQERRREMPLERLQRSAPTPTGRRSFAQAVGQPGRVNLIAEFKRRSPSRGVIREDLHPVNTAQAYEIGGAAALSILTEEQFFGGSLQDMSEARAATFLPTLRKDFVVDPYQVWEAWYAGADAVLLIVAALDDAELVRLLGVSAEVGLDALVEVHDRVELDRALRAGARLVGVNNRDLRTMEVSLETGLELAERIPDDVLAVAESGIRGPGELRMLREAGYDAFLVGEHLMLSPDPATAVEALIHDSSVPRWPGRHRARRRVAVKVCGITSVEDGLMAAAAGADAIGLVFWPRSPRAVDLERARAIAAALPPFVLRVGVFVDAAPDEIARAVAAAGLDVLQLHGEEPPESLDGLPRRALKAVRVGPGFQAADALRYEGRAAGILLDTRLPEGGPPGGTGRTFDWRAVREVRDRVAWLALAGGLDAENVSGAIAEVHPDAVDVSSGVEAAPGRKDAARVRAFIEAVRKASA
jgi:indole-3-glycerol phosphate synthase / phosphoribosylanthranilate isomerase